MNRYDLCPHWYEVLPPVAEERLIYHRECRICGHAEMKYSAELAKEWPTREAAEEALSEPGLDVLIDETRE